MTNFKRSLFWLVMLCLTAIACNDPSDLGSELIEGDFSDIKFTDTLTVNTLNVAQNSIFTYTNKSNSQPSSYLVGNIDEPVFGSAKASTYMSFVLGFTSQAGGADFGDAIFDSLVLSLVYDTLGTYGDTLITQDFRVYQVEEEMETTVDYYYSDRGFLATEIIGEKLGFNPRPKTNIVTITDEDTITTIPNLRIKLNDELGMAFMDTLVYDSVAYSTSEQFKQLFSGIKISSTVPNANILGFNLGSSLTYLRLYYTRDTTQLTYTFGLSTTQSVKYSEYEHDYSGAVVEPFIDNQAASDSLVFIQGMSGTNVKIDFPSISTLEDVIVNKAELEFTAAYIPGDDTISYNPPTRVALTYLADDGNFYFIEDLALSLAVGDLSTFGGAPIAVDDNGMYIQKYTMNISNYIQDLIDCTDSQGFISNCLSNNAVDNSLYLQIYTKNQFATRGVFYGGSHSQYPVKLSLTYTQQ